MAKLKVDDDHFKFTYRADCLTCGKYVGSKRKDRLEAVADAVAHKTKPVNATHNVKIETTQIYHI